MAGMADDQHLEFAASQGLVLFSYNIGDYAELVTKFFEQGITHAGIVLVEQYAFDVGEQMRRLVKLSNTLSNEEMENRLEFLNAWGK